MADYEPPWVRSAHEGKHFTVPGVENVPDLHGDIVDAQLVIFFGGNQFMVTHDLVAAFQRAHPQYSRIYWQTLPPGVMVAQIAQGALIIGNLRIACHPDILTAGQGRIATLNQERGWFDRVADYARNRLSIMVSAGNPKGVRGLADLARADVRVAMPNPEWEGIGARIEEAYRKAGGEDLVTRIMQDKVADGSTFLTQIHHRQTPLRILRGESDAGPVWYTEVSFQERIGHPIARVPVPPEHNITAIYTAGRLKDAPHPRAAADFLAFLCSDAGQAIYRDYGFWPAR